MVYAGALASGAFASQHVVLFGNEITTPLWAFMTMALAGATGYLVGSWAGWGIGRYGGRSFVERHGRLLHLGPERLVRAERWFERHDDRRCCSAASCRSSARSCRFRPGSSGCRSAGTHC